MKAVGIPESCPDRSDCYPFQMSGGMQQRAVIAAAVGAPPIPHHRGRADHSPRRNSAVPDPATAGRITGYHQYRLDSYLPRSGSRRERMFACLCMYAAQIVESGPIERVYNAPAHPYTKALLGTILDPLEKKESLTVLTGSIPDSGRSTKRVPLPSTLPHGDGCMRGAGAAHVFYS